MLVIADLLGVPEEDHPEFLEKLLHNDHIEMTHSPLEYLYAQFTSYIEDRRRQPRDDVMTGLATATFPDGSLPPVEDVMKIASNLFAAGQETTARLLGTALMTLAERPELQQQLRDDRSLIPAFIEESLRLQPPINGTFRLSRTPTTVRDTTIPAGSTVMVLPSAANRDPREFEHPDELRLDRVTPASTSPSATASTPVPVPPWPAPRPTSPCSAYWTGWRRSESRNRTTGRPGSATGSTRPPGCSGATIGSTSSSPRWVAQGAC